MKYYIIYPNKQIEFLSYIHLINYLLKDSCPSWYTCKHTNQYEKISNRIKICDNDTYLGVVSTSKSFIYSLGIWIDHNVYGLLPRDIQIVDEHGKNAVTSEFLNDLNKYTFRKDIEDTYNKIILESTKKYSIYDSFSFRSDPVPGTGHRSHRRYWRNPQTLQEKKNSCDLEYKEFVRRSRSNANLPSNWDDIGISSYHDISWKRCTKNKHQWENHVKIKSKHIYVFQEKKVDEVSEED